MAAHLPITLLLLLWPPVHAFRFDLQSGQTKCIHEDIRNNTISVGKYSVVDAAAVPGSDIPPRPSYADPSKISAKVVGPWGENVHYAENVDSGNFAFTAPAGGRYLACFWVLPRQESSVITVEFDWNTGVFALHRPAEALAGRGNLASIKVQLDIMEVLVMSIREETKDHLEREMELRDFNMATESIISWLSILSLAVCMSVAGVQLWHLKRFFQKKKIV